MRSWSVRDRQNSIEIENSGRLGFRYRKVLKSATPGGSVADWATMVKSILISTKTTATNPKVVRSFTDHQPDPVNKTSAARSMNYKTIKRQSAADLVRNQILNSIESGEIERFTVVDGLHAVDATTLTYDAGSDFVWIGYGDGVLDRIDVTTGDISTFLDISRAQQFAARGVNRIRVQGDSLLIATDFGIVVFDTSLSEVRATYSRLGATRRSQPGVSIRDPSSSDVVPNWCCNDGRNVSARDKWSSVAGP